MLTRLYTVHLNPKLGRPMEQPVFIADGFNPYAFVFGGLWALYQRMWFAAIVFFCLYRIVIYVGAHFGLSWTSTLILQLGIQFMIGLAANDLRRSTLERRGWIASDVVIADSLLEAMRRFYDRHLGQIEASYASPRAAAA